MSIPLDFISEAQDQVALAAALSRQCIFRCRAAEGPFKTRPKKRRNTRDAGASPVPTKSPGWQAILGRPWPLFSHARSGLEIRRCVCCQRKMVDGSPALGSAVSEPSRNASLPLKLIAPPETARARYRRVFRSPAFQGRTKPRARPWKARLRSGTPAGNAP